MEGDIMVLPNLEFAVLRVAIDHMIEFLEDVYLDSDAEPWEHEELHSRLEAAKRLKERFS